MYLCSECLGHDDLKAPTFHTFAILCFYGQVADMFTHQVISVYTESLLKYHETRSAVVLS